VTVTRTYLEMRDPHDLHGVSLSNPDIRVDRVHNCPPSFWRYLYTEVGRASHWNDRLPWTEAMIRAYLTDPALSLYVLSVSGAPAGYFELRRDDDGGVEIAYFGLLPEFTGRGLGGFMLTEAVRRAWQATSSRVWLHTNTMDHPAALPNYLKRGFTVVRTEEYEPGV
jgi:ribosomal protein S18 acetylase RimI-like enzyme